MVIATNPTNAIVNLVGRVLSVRNANVIPDACTAPALNPGTVYVTMVGEACSAIKISTSAPITCHVVTEALALTPEKEVTPATAQRALAVKIAKHPPTTAPEPLVYTEEHASSQKMATLQFASALQDIKVLYAKLLYHLHLLPAAQDLLARMGERALMLLEDFDVAVVRDLRVPLAIDVWEFVIPARVRIEVCVLKLQEPHTVFVAPVPLDLLEIAVKSTWTIVSVAILA